MTKTYFWLSDKAQQIGDIIKPGNWGRVVKNTPNHPWRKMEAQFEQMRLETNPAAPSRLECAFVFEDIETARLLRTKRPNDLIYEVELIDDDAPTLRTEMALVHPELERWDAHYGNPRRYWAIEPGAELQWPEILTTSRLKMVRVLAG